MKRRALAEQVGRNATGCLGEPLNLQDALNLPIPDLIERGGRVPCQGVRYERYHLFGRKVERHVAEPALDLLPLRAP